MQWENAAVTKYIPINARQRSQLYIIALTIDPHSVRMSPIIRIERFTQSIFATVPLYGSRYF